MLEKNMLINNRYRIQEQIGVGGMAIVYRAIDEKLDREVTFKVLKEDYINDEEFIKRFSTEARAAARLSNNNIVNVYDVGNDGNIHYIVMEYIDGFTLKELISSKAPFTDEEAVGIGLQIGAALEHAHKNGIVHRDIKPENILITKSGNIGTIKVTDFGIAKATTSKTSPIDFMGSVHYFSPEQAKGENVDTRSDIYSLGIVLFEMVTGQLPFTGETAVALAMKHLKEPIPDIKAINPNVSDNLVSVIKKATCKEPKNRYQTIAELVKDKRLDHIADVRDESDREGMRIAIELRRDVNPNIILNQLYKHTQLQDTFGVIMLALVDNQPKVLNLYDMLKYYLLHQEEVVTRRTKFDLNKAEERAHILEGLMIALDNIDRVISIIRGSANVQIAKESLIAEFALSEAQAQAIVDMRLRALTGLERSKLEAELKELHEKIKEYKAILADKKLLLGVIKTEISEIADKYGDDRRTSIGYDEYDISMEDLIPDEPCVIARTNLGYVKRMTPDNFKSQHRGGKGIKGMQTIDDDYIKDLFMTTSHHVLTFFTNTGRAYKLKAYEIPEASRTSRGTAIINLLQLAPGETITAVVPVKIDTLQDTDYLFMATKKGIVKKTPVKDFANIRKTGIQAINLREDDELIEVKLTDDQAEILMVTMLGQCIRFKETDVRPTGRSAMGVIGMSLMDEDEVVGVQVSTQGDTMLIVSENGMGKRTDIDEYTVQHRGGKGVKCYKITEKTGNVVGAKAVDDSREVMLITTEGIIIRLQCSDISNLGRITSGVKLINLDEGIKVATIAKVRKQPADEDGKDAEGFEEDTDKTVESED